MSIHLVSVMHTGTHLLQSILNHEQRFHGPNRLIRYHTDTEHNHDITQAEYVFSPLRHPRRIAESWRRRREDGKPHLTQAYLYTQLDKLMEEFHPHITLYLHVDHPNRDKEVERLGELTEQIMRPNWDRANRDTGCNYQTHDVALKDCPSVPKRYEHFYFDTMI